MLVVALLLSGLARAADLQVEVENVRNGRGAVRVTVCPRADFLQPHCPWSASVPARAPAVSVTVHDIPPGVYAVQAHHDENGNGRIDRNLLGMPTEGIGFSRDAPFRFGPPSFADAAIALPEAGARIVLRLRYFS